MSRLVPVLLPTRSRNNVICRFVSAEVVTRVTETFIFLLIWIWHFKV
jgi:hypothetical protein